MKTLYIEANMGAAGDMLTAALIELLDDRTAFLGKLNGLGIPEVVYSLEESTKCGIKGSHMSVYIKGTEEESHDVHEEHSPEHHHEHSHDHNQDHHHGHEHGHVHHDHEDEHHHSGLLDIQKIIDSLPVSDKVKKDAYGVYSIIAEAESHVHGRPVDEVHFHEVGAMDAVADVVAVCMLMEEIKPESVIVSPINTGYGHCHTMHGILPIPAPATARILEGMPSYDGGVRGELCTPTGAALLKHFATSYGPRPVISILKTGYGMGKKDFERANCIRAILGETEDRANDTVIELEANIDDMSAEDMAYATEKLLASGVLDVWTENINMKKGRPGIKLSVLCREEDEKAIVSAIFRHTSTIGIRRAVKTRYVLKREAYEKDTAYGKVGYKRSYGYGAERNKPEFEDLKRIAEEKGISLREVRDNI